MADRDKPRDKTLQAWKTEYSWLEIDVNGMKCDVCKKWKAKISSVKNFSDAFLKSSTNYRKSNVLA